MAADPGLDQQLDQAQHAGTVGKYAGPPQRGLDPQRLLEHDGVALAEIRHRTRALAMGVERLGVVGNPPVVKAPNVGPPVAAIPERGDGLEVSGKSRAPEQHGARIGNRVLDRECLIDLRAAFLDVSAAPFLRLMLSV